MRRHDRVAVKSTPFNNAIGALAYLAREIDASPASDPGRRKWLAERIQEEVEKLKNLEAEARDHERNEREDARVRERIAAINEGVEQAGFSEADALAGGLAI